MNIYIYHISLTNYMILEKIEVNNQVMLKFERVEIGPFRWPNPNTVKLIKDTISDIPSEPVKSNWWIDYSNWQDFHRILRSGTKLSLHSVISRIEDKFKLRNPSQYLNLKLRLGKSYKAHPLSTLSLSLYPQVSCLFSQSWKQTITAIQAQLK